jgi:hypothetical protein
VALSADGNTAVVGQQVNGAWVFTRSVGLWTQQAHLQITGLSEDAYNGAGAQGYAVAIAGDANTIAVGAPFDNKIAGATAVFTRTGNQWAQQGPKLVGTAASGASGQGNALALSADGNSLLVGAPFDTPANGTGFGAVWFFTRSGGVWSQQGGKVQAAELSLTPEEFGWAVALSGDGDTAVIGGLRSTYSPN